MTCSDDAGDGGDRLGAAVAGDGKAGEGQGAGGGGDDFVRVRSYTVSITYDKYYQVPHPPARDMGECRRTASQRSAQHPRRPTAGSADLRGPGIGRRRPGESERGRPRKPTTPTKGLALL